jgi:hypothetical protein
LAATDSYPTNMKDRQTLRKIAAKVLEGYDASCAAGKYEMTNGEDAIVFAMISCSYIVKNKKHDSTYADALDALFKFMEDEIKEMSQFDSRNSPFG